MKRWIALAPVVCLLALAILTPAWAQAPTQTEVTFDLTSSRCSQLPTGTTIHGTGTASLSATSGGHLHTVVNGIATDGAGGFWRFNYADNMRPIGGGAYEVTDHFNLVGSGSPIKLHSHFVVDFTSSDLESADVLAIKQIHGDPIGCDLDWP